MDPHPTALPALGSRALFPSLAAGIYLNHAGISPPSALVAAAVQDALGAWAELGSGAFPRFMLQRDRLKEQLSGLIGATARDLALRPNTTQGVIDVAGVYNVLKDGAAEYSTLEVGGDDNLLKSYAYLKQLGAE